MDYIDIVTIIFLSVWFVSEFFKGLDFFFDFFFFFQTLAALQDTVLACFSLVPNSLFWCK